MYVRFRDALDIIRELSIEDRAGEELKASGDIVKRGESPGSILEGDSSRTLDSDRGVCITEDIRTGSENGDVKP